MKSVKTHTNFFGSARGNIRGCTDARRNEIEEIYCAAQRTTAARVHLDAGCTLESINFSAVSRFRLMRVDLAPKVRERWRWYTAGPVSDHRREKLQGFSMDGLEIRRKRAIYRALHRGTKELDLILGRYAKEHVPGMDEARLTLFEHLLSLPDADIDQWIRGHEAPGDVAVAIAEVRGFYGLAK
jgi:antitoxin CptB